MRMSIFFTTCMFVLGLWLAFAASASFAEISEERAIEIANGFCRRIGWQPSKVPKAKFETSPSGYQTVWGVTYGEYPEVEYEIRMGAETGKIFSAGDFSHRHTRAAEEGPVKVTREEAIVIATRYLEAGFGTPPDAEFEKAELIVSSIGREGTLIYWSVKWRRTFQGIPYKGDGMGASLHPDTGKVWNMGRAWSQPEPEAILRFISQEKAIEIAKEHLISRGIWAGKPLEAALYVLQPNYHFTNNAKDLVKRKDPTTIVWEVVLGYPKGQKRVWVQAGTGAVVGGVVPPGGPGAPDLKLPKSPPSFWRRALAHSILLAHRIPWLNPREVLFALAAFCLSGVLGVRVWRRRKRREISAEGERGVIV